MSGFTITTQIQLPLGLGSQGVSYSSAQILLYDSWICHQIICIKNENSKFLTFPRSTNINVLVPDFSEYFPKDHLKITEHYVLIKKLITASLSCLKFILKFASS